MKRFFKALGEYLLLIVLSISFCMVLIILEEKTGLDPMKIYMVLVVLVLGATVVLMIQSSASKSELRKYIEDIKEECLRALQPHMDSAFICMPFATLNTYTERSGKPLSRFRDRQRLNRPCFVALTQTRIFIVTMNLFFEPDPTAFFLEGNMEQLHIKKSSILRQYIVVMKFSDIEVKIRLPLCVRGADLEDQEEQVHRFLEQINIERWNKIYNTGPISENHAGE